jgi:cytochrome c peroxidase
MSSLRVVLCGMIVLLAWTAGVAKGEEPLLTPEQQLGKELFFDRISDPSWVSCATCHAPRAGWTGAIPGLNVHGGVYRGAVPKRFGNRKPPTSAYVTFGPVFHQDETTGEFVGGSFWDGRATGERLGSPAADQALGPFLNPVEQNMPSTQAVCDVVAASKYADLFVDVWGSGSLDCSEAGVEATYDKIGLSIAAYEGSSEVSPFSSKFDAYWEACLAAGNGPEECGLAEGDQEVLDPSDVLSDLEFDGLIEFGEYCAPCHVSHRPGPGGVPPLFTDFSYENIGVPRNPENPFYEMDEVFLDDGSPINPLGEDFIDFGLGDFLMTGSSRFPRCATWTGGSVQGSPKPTCTTGSSRPSSRWSTSTIPGMSPRRTGPRRRCRRTSIARSSKGCPWATSSWMRKRNMRPWRS